MALMFAALVAAQADVGLLEENASDTSPVALLAPDTPQYSQSARIRASFELEPMTLTIDATADIGQLLRSPFIGGHAGEWEARARLDVTLRADGRPRRDLAGLLFWLRRLDPDQAEACPDLRMVIDHLAKPPIASGEYDSWKAEMTTAAQFPNVYAKVSGLNTAADWERWSASDLVEPIGHALEAFGADRLMFGSDWPVAVLAGDYAKVWTETNTALDELAVRGDERAAILGATAAAFYRIDV